MHGISTVKDIPKFSEKVPVYIDVGLEKKVIKTTTTGKEYFGFLVGDVIKRTRKEYVLITDIISNVEDLDEKIDGSKIVVGSFFHGVSLEYHIDELPYGMTERSYYIILKYDISKNYEDIEFETYKLYTVDSSDKAYKVNHKFVPLSSGSDVIDDEIRVNEEIAIFREAERSLSYLMLSIFAAFFGVFGGVLGYLLSKKQTTKRRFLLLIIGCLSTIVWFALPHLA